MSNTTAYYPHRRTGRTSPRNDARNGLGGVADRSLTNGDATRGMNGRVPGTLAQGGSFRPGATRRRGDSTRGGVLVGPNTTTSDASAAMTMPSRRSGDPHKQENRAHKHWKVETGVSGGGSGCAEAGGVENIMLRASLEVTPAAAAAAAAADGSTPTADGRTRVEPCEPIGCDNADGRSGKGRPGVRMLPSLESRGSLRFANADGWNEGEGSRTGGGISLVQNNAANGNCAGAVGQHGTTYTLAVESQVTKVLRQAAGSAGCFSGIPSLKDLDILLSIRFRISN